MQELRQLGGALLLGLLSIVIVIGGIMLALAEGNLPGRVISTPSATETLAFLTALPSPLFPTNLPNSPIPNDTPTLTVSPPAYCPPPPGWILAAVGPGETLEILAARYRTTPEALRAANCLVLDSLLPGYGIYVPPVPANTSVPCGVPFGWVQYTVQPGDNLYRISQSYRVTVTQLQQANCLGYSTTIYSGQKLWVPNVPTSTGALPPLTIDFASATPIPTNTPTLEPSPTPTPTETVIPSTETASPTPPPTETPSPPATP